MKHNSTFTSFLAFLILVLLFTIASMLLTSCSGVRYSYFNKQKVPYTASEDAKFARAIPAKPLLSQSESELKGKISSEQKKNNQQQNVKEDEAQKKTRAPLKPGQFFDGINIAKYFPKESKSIQSKNGTNDDERTLMIVLLIVLILILVGLLGNDLLWLLFVALLIFLIYYLIVYLGIFK